jgi:hypothetical protein
MMASEQYDPTVLPIFFSDAVYLTYSHRAICCVVGLHGVKSVSKGPASGNGKQEINTYIWASWDYSEHFGNGNDLGGKPAGGDIDILSHEIAEWLSDPFANNTVPAWQSPLAPGYGCVDWFEVADPLIVEDFEVNGYHLQDAAFKSWFAHDVPSQAINGQYSFFGTFTTPSILCGK